MFSVENKFECKEECWSVYRKPIKYDCPICNGAGSFEFNGYSVKCSNCCGSGKLHNSKQFLMDICRVQVRRIKVSNFGNLISVSYVVSPLDNKINIKNRSETNLFKTQEIAEEYCISVNKKEVAKEF